MTRTGEEMIVKTNSCHHCCYCSNIIGVFIDICPTRCTSLGKKNLYSTNLSISHVTYRKLIYGSVALR